MQEKQKVKNNEIVEIVEVFIEIYKMIYNLYLEINLVPRARCFTKTIIRDEAVIIDILLVIFSIITSDPVFPLSSRQSRVRNS